MRKGFDFIGVTVSFFCHDGKGNFIMGKRSNKCRDEHGKWDTGGGGMEFGLSVEENLRKEIMEEYCTEVLDFEFLGFRDVHREHNGEKTHWIALDYKVLVDPGLVKNGEPDMCDEVKWFNLQSKPVEEEMHSQIPKVFDRYKAVLESF